MKFIVILSVLALVAAQTGMETGIVPTAPPAATGTETGAPPAETAAPSDTALPPSGTAVPPAGTGLPPSDTAVPPSGTALPPSDTAVPPSGTALPPAGTGTIVPPAGTGTAVPPSGTGTAVAPTGNCDPNDIEGLDGICNEAVALFQGTDPGAAIFPGIGLPSQNNGVCTITHTMGPDAPKLEINGLVSNSPLSNNALFSFECAVAADGSTGGDWLNLYEIMVGDGAKKNGERSAGQTYINQLHANGLDVTGTHYHWTGVKLAGESFVIAVHHQNVGLHPTEFIQKTGHAIGAYMNATKPVEPEPL